MRHRTTGRAVALAAALTLLLTGCDDGGSEPSPPADSAQPDAAGATSAAPDGSAESDDASVTTEPVAAPLIADDVTAELDAAVEAESQPIATSSAQTEGLPDGATLDVLQLDRTEAGGYLLRVRLSWPEPISLSPDQQRSLSLDGEAVFVDGMRLVDPGAERLALPTVYAPQDEEQIDDTERFRCLCSDLVSKIPAQGQILSALYGPLGGDAEPDTLTLEVPGFEPVTEVPVGRAG